MLQIDWVEYKNFFSSGSSPTRVDLSKHKTTLITGTNGTGKTTLLFAIQFGLFGKCDREVNKDLIVNTFNGKECEVSVQFRVFGKPYRVVRGIKPNLLEIYEANGDVFELLDQTDVKAYQDMLETKILKTNYKTFNQIVCMSPTKYTPFMRMPAAQRRQIIEDILDINIFSEMNLKLKERISSTKADVTNIDGDYRVQEEKIRGIKNTIASVDSIVEQSKSSMDETQKLISNLEKKNELHRKTVESLTEKIESIPLSDLKQKLSDLKESSSDLKGEKTSLEKVIGNFEKLDVCPTCKQDVTKEYKEPIIEDAKQQIENILPRLEKTSNKIDTILTLIEKYDEIRGKIRSEEEQIRTNTSSIEQLSKQLKSKKDAVDVSEHKSALLEAETLLRKLTDKKCDLQQRQTVLQVVKQLLSDNGIKAKIVKDYVPVINAATNKYLEALDFFVSFELDENFNETIKSRHRDKFTYESFSEGQKQRIDLSLLFAFREVAKAKNSLNCNLIFFDEILDSHLDDAGVRDLLDILSTEENSNIFVISHKSPDTIGDRFERCMKTYMNGNYGEIKEEN